MPIRESASERGARRGRQLRARTSAELDDARLSGGLSLRELARRLRVSPGTVKRALRGEPSVLTIDFVARLAAVLGLQLSVGLHPDGDPVRDRGHLALLDRLHQRLGPRLRWRTEVPIPIAGDHRSGDALVEGDGFDILVEAETHLHDVQALERSIAAKQRDLGVARVILLVANTRHNRRVIELAPEFRRRFPIGTRACLAALTASLDPGGDALVIL
ncbi:MAG: helix-turn-helix transcriptional regulator [Chloroflexi bacterium]|nr:helix-turn-helix transcriptional regulator [Chloroflexota bacterium]